MIRLKKLLLVDDDPVFHDLLTEFVRQEPYRLLHLYDGEKVLELAGEEKPDLILLDVMLPFSDGRDICRKLKSDPSTKDIPVIMVTGNSDQCDRMMGLDLGVAEYVTKPFTRISLMSSIKNVLSKYPR